MARLVPVKFRVALHMRMVLNCRMPSRQKRVAAAGPCECKGFVNGERSYKNCDGSRGDVGKSRRLVLEAKVAERRKLLKTLFRDVQACQIIVGLCAAGNRSFDSCVHVELPAIVGKRDQFKDPRPQALLWNDQSSLRDANRQFLSTQVRKYDDV